MIDNLWSDLLEIHLKIMIWYGFVADFLKMEDRSMERMEENLIFLLDQKYQRVLHRFLQVSSLPMYLFSPQSCLFSID